MTRSGTGSSLCATVAASLVVATTFGSVALAQPAQAPPPSWHGTFEWTHVCNGPPGFGVKTRGVGKLELFYSASGYVEQDSTHHPNWTLNGRIDGTVPEHLPLAPSCSSTMVAPGTFSGPVHGSYAPGQDRFSVEPLYVYRTATNPGVAIVCPYATQEVSLPFAEMHQTAIFPDAFRELRRHPGNWKSNGERVVSVGESTCTTTYALTLYGCGENMPERGMVYGAPGRSPKLHSAPSTDSSVLGSLPSGQRVRYTQTRQVNRQTWFFIDLTGRQGWALASDFSCGQPIRPPAKKIILPPELMELYQGKAALASAGRG